MSDKPTRHQRREAQAARSVAARAVGLSYGPCECRREDADEHLPVSTVVNNVEQVTTKPVQWITTRNRGILESVVHRAPAETL